MSSATEEISTFIPPSPVESPQELSATQSGRVYTLLNRYNHKFLLLSFGVTVISIIGVAGFGILMTTCQKNLESNTPSCDTATLNTYLALDIASAFVSLIGVIFTSVMGFIENKKYNSYELVPLSHQLTAGMN